MTPEFSGRCLAFQGRRNHRLVGEADDALIMMPVALDSCNATVGQQVVMLTDAPLGQPLPQRAADPWWLGRSSIASGGGRPQQQLHSRTNRSRGESQTSRVVDS